jgi:glyoxylase-like metal-dependent hydrolase (beta-lactamase superfamily II)
LSFPTYVLYYAAAASTAIAGMLHLMLGPGNLGFNVNQGILFVVGGMAQVFWIIPMLMRWGRVWYGIGIAGTVVFIALFFITRMPGNPITGRGAGTNPTSLTLEIFQIIFVGLATAIIIYESKLAGKVGSRPSEQDDIKKRVPSSRKKVAILTGVVVALVLIGLFLLPTVVPRPMGGPMGQGGGPPQQPTQEGNNSSTTGIFMQALEYTQTAVPIDQTKGYSVVEIADDVYWLVGSGYQTMFLATGQGLIVIDAPQPLGGKYLQAIRETTSEPITHMIYSHPHPDHVGAAGQIFPANITYIAHKETADALAEADDPNRPVPTVTFENQYTLSVGKQTIELYHVGNYHSTGDTVIYLPEQRVAMAVDLLRPGITPFRAFAVTPDIDQYIEMHRTLLEDFDFAVLVSGHTQLLATKENVNTNLEFTLDVMENSRQALETSTGPDAIKSCSDITVSQWEGRLGNLEEFMSEHCTAMIEYLQQN